MSAVVDMGIFFDGKCAVCREWIENEADPWTVLDHEPEGAEHHIAHWVCATGGEHAPDGVLLYSVADPNEQEGPDN